MTVSHSRWKFWLVLVAALLGVGITGSLGTWQIGRAHMKESLLAQRQAREKMTALDWPDFQNTPHHKDLSYLFDRPVHLRGQWMPQATVFLDNRPMAGRSGFFVLTPLLPANGGPAILVQRGWVPRHFADRTKLPELATPAGVVDVIGRLAPPPSKLYDLGADEQGAIRQNVDVESFEKEWSLRLVEASVLQINASGVAPDGLLRDWPRVGGDVHKHYGYAFQWFGLSALIALLYVWFQIIAPRRRRA